MRVHFIYKLVKLFMLGPGLIFVVYAEGLSTMSAAPFWSVWFYFMISLLGFTSQVSGSFTFSRIAMLLHRPTFAGIAVGVWSVRSGRGLLHSAAGRVPRVPETRAEAGHPTGSLLHHHLPPRPAHGHRGDMWQVLSPAVTSLSRTVELEAIYNNVVIWCVLCKGRILPVYTHRLVLWSATHARWISGSCHHCMGLWSVFPYTNLALIVYTVLVIRVGFQVFAFCFQCRCWKVLRRCRHDDWPTTPLVLASHVVYNCPCSAGGA